MSTAGDLTAADQRRLPVRLRSDLSHEKHTYQGNEYWIVKEPLKLRYFRFGPREHALLKMFDGRGSLAEIRDRFEREFPPHTISLERLHQFLGSLHQNGLVVSNLPGQGRRLLERRNKVLRQQVFAKLANPMAVRFRGIDPEQLLARLYPKVRWLFTWQVFWIWAATIASAALLLAMQWDVFQRRLPSFHEFFGPGNWLPLAASLAIVKIIHELGHGLTCNHYGGRCHELGLMFLVLTPTLYVNVSDSWLLPSKWQRAAIAAAGIAVELFLAAAATFVWWWSEPGLVQNLALNAMFLCSVSTLLFNGNPLLRFDGYYILSDLMEVPNLAAKANRLLQRTLGRWCLGIEPPEDPLLPERNRLLFAGYAVAAIAYRCFVLVMILLFLNHVFEPYGLKVVGQMIAMYMLATIIVLPLWKLVRFLRLPGRMSQIKSRNVGITAAVLTAVGLILFYPLPHAVYCPLEVQPAGAKRVYVEVPGILQKVDVRPGQQIEAGGTIAELKNFDLLVSEAELAGEKAELASRLAALRRLRVHTAAASDEIPQTAELLAKTTEQLALTRKEIAQLEVQAPAAGTVLNPPSKPPETNGQGGSARLPSWTGSPLEEKNVGAWLAAGDLFCLIGDPRRMEAVLVVDQADMPFVEPRQQVEMLLDLFPGSTYAGKITEISQRDLQIASSRLSVKSGGELTTETAKGGYERPVSASFQARVPLPYPSDHLRTGLRGRAKIRTAPLSLGYRLWRALTRTFRFRL